MQTVTFNGALDAIESLSIEDQEALITIIQKRIIDRRRAEIATHIVQAKAEHQAGQVFRGSIEDAIAELNQ
jgi:transcriptional regulator with AAA-type ATPase domain